MAWKQNIIEDFKQLVSFDSISFHERKTADWLIERLQKMGFSVEEDDAGSHYGGDTGNLYAVLDGTLPGDPVIFCAHMDVVESRSGKKSVLEKTEQYILPGILCLVQMTSVVFWKFSMVYNL